MKTITYNPETHVLVPIEPSEEMCDAATADSCWESMNPPPSTAYRLMIAAAPQPEPVDSEPVAWLDVAWFDSYEISNQGDLRNKKTGKVQSKNLAGAGYIKASLWANGKRKQTTIHRLVADEFLGESNGREVNHKNGNKQDNRVSNLEWCSRSENVTHGYYELGIRIKPIKVTDTETGESKQYKSVREAVRDGFNSARVHECLSGKRKSHNGFVFEYTTTPQPDRVAELEAALKVARDALRYYGGDKYGTFANEAYAKINEVLKP